MSSCPGIKPVNIQREWPSHISTSKVEAPGGTSPRPVTLSVDPTCTSEGYKSQTYSTNENEMVAARGSVRELTVTEIIRGVKDESDEYANEQLTFSAHSAWMARATDAAPSRGTTITWTLRQIQHSERYFQTFSCDSFRYQ